MTILSRTRRPDLIEGTFEDDIISGEAGTETLLLDARKSGGHLQIGYAFTMTFFSGYGEGVPYDMDRIYFRGSRYADSVIGLKETIVSKVAVVTTT